jgi:hypothetical protein
VTTQYPDVDASPGNYIKVSLNGLGSTDVYTLLGLLADQVLSGKLDQQQIDSKKYWQEWGLLLKKTLTAAGKLGHGVTVDVDTKVLKVTISGKDVS